MHAYRFQLLRYVPDAVKDEFINIGVMLLDDEGRCIGTRMGGEDDLRRVRCLHPAADLELIRSWQAQIQAEMEQHPEHAPAWLETLDETASLSLRALGPKGCEAQDASAALQALYESFIASPPRARADGMRPGTGPWVKHEAESAFRAAHLLERFEAGVFAEKFTWPGDPFRIHYGYRNGSPHYIHMLSLHHSVQQAKALAFTFGRITRAESDSRMTAVVEPEGHASSTASFTRQLLTANQISVVPLDRIQGFVRRVQQELRIM